MDFFLEMLLTAVVALLFSFLVAKLVSTASVAGGDDHTSDQAEIGVGGDGFETDQELRFGMKMDVGVIESDRDYRVVDENVELVDRFESEGDQVDEVEKAATGNADVREELVVLTAEAESTASVSPDNVIAEEMIVSGHDERRDSAEQINASSFPENVVAEETLSQGTEKISACVDVIVAESEEVNVEESNTVEESDSEEENEEKEELSIEDDDDWEGIERSELEKAFVAASNLLADESGKAEEISADAKMELYGLHKIATEGPCREAQPMAIMASARAKWNAWQKLGNMNQEEAMEQYLALVSKEIPDLINTVGKMPEFETSVVLPPNSGTTLDTTRVDSSKMFQGKGESSV